MKTTTTSPDVRNSSPRQTVGGTVSNGYAAWLGTPNTDISSLDWQIFTEDLGCDADPVLVATGERVDESGFRAPGISGDRVYWQTTFELEDFDGRTEVRSVPLGGGDVRIEPDLAAMPAAVGGGIVAEQLREFHSLYAMDVGKFESRYLGTSSCADNTILSQVDDETT